MGHSVGRGLGSRDRQAARADGGAVHAGRDPPPGPRFFLGLLADLPRKNCWTIAEHAGTGDLEKGTHTVGVQRKYTGTAGRVENAQVAVYLPYTGARGHAMIDRELHLPQSWTTDPDRPTRPACPPRSSS